MIYASGEGMYKEMDRYEKPLSYNWWIEEEKVWYIDALRQTLFTMDRRTLTAHMVSQLPVDITSRYLKCIKAENRILCMPGGAEDNICIYDISGNTWKQVQIDAASDIRLNIVHVYQYQGKIYAVLKALNQIAELNLETERIENYYDFPVRENNKVKVSILVNHYIYTVSSTLSSVFEFNCLTKKMQMYPLKIQEDELQTICFDGRNFWLSGRLHKIYVWNKELNQIWTLKGFPAGFGRYHFSDYSKVILEYDETGCERIFRDTVYAGGRIWFIPLRTNKILYSDKNAFLINEFAIEDEMEDEVSLKRKGHKFKYILEYVSDGRYIGLYSVKNRRMIEIDALRLTYQFLNWSLDEAAVEAVRKIEMKNAFSNRIVKERDEKYLGYFMAYLKENESNRNSQSDSMSEIGRKIYLRV